MAMSLLAAFVMLLSATSFVLVFASTIDVLSFFSSLLVSAVTSFFSDEESPKSFFSSSALFFAFSFSALQYFTASSIAESHRLAAGSQVLSSSEQPFHRIRYSTRLRRILRPRTAATSQKKSPSFGAATIVPSRLSKPRPALRARLRDSSSSSFICCSLRCFLIFMIPVVRLERPLGCFCCLCLFRGASFFDAFAFAGLLFLAAVASRLAVALRFNRASA
mmetsp:Transcript_16456/g.27981  ORF Transcript_16456/g.27981 Transcript_16456/m.27981 type:complete len:220 (+) Transcript_16456:321-980(+)